MPLDELCHCGRPLHYADPAIRRLVERMIRHAGSEFLIIQTADGRRWRVQRHYIALHGIKGREIPNLGFEEITDAV